MLEAGKYRARAIEAAIGITSTGKAQVGILYRLLDQPKTLTWYGFFTDDCVKRTVESLRFSGWKGDDIDDLSSLCNNETPEVTLVVEIENDLQGNPRERVRWVNRAGGGLGMKTVMPPDQAKELANSLRDKIIAADIEAGIRVGDDLPF